MNLRLEALLGKEVTAIFYYDFKLDTDPNEVKGILGIEKGGNGDYGGYYYVREIGTDGEKRDRYIEVQNYDTIQEYVELTETLTSFNEKEMLVIAEAIMGMKAWERPMLIKWIQEVVQMTEEEINSFFDKFLVQE